MPRPRKPFAVPSLEEARMELSDVNESIIRQKKLLIALERDREHAELMLQLAERDERIRELSSRSGNA